VRRTSVEAVDQEMEVVGEDPATLGEVVVGKDPMAHGKAAVTEA
jgi:hypothetical protein